VAIIKGYAFAFVISTIPSYFGYYVEGGALEIGKASTRAVVVSCVALLGMDYLVSQILLQNT
jgi:phospholipid/cholesterol/gamma-HCH transport system permease protein